MPHYLTPHGEPGCAVRRERRRVGTSSPFPYVSAALSGRTTIEINPADTPLSNVVGVRVQASAGAALREIYGRLGVHCGVSMAQVEQA